MKKVIYSEDGFDEDVTKDVEINEFLKESDIRYEYDWGNGHAIIISFEETVVDKETLIKAVKEQLGLT